MNGRSQPPRGLLGGPGLEAPELSELPDLPSRPGALYDMLQRLFGLGDHDDLLTDEPYFRARNREIAKLKAMLKRRRTTVTQLATAAWWADVNRMPVHSAFSLLRHVGVAQAAWDSAAAQSVQATLDARVEDAINEALYAEEHQWVEQFVRAEPAQLPALLDAFAQHMDQHMDQETR